MKFKFLFLCALAVVLSSCEDSVSMIEKTLVVEQVNANDDVKEEDCGQCSTSDKYKYEVKIRSYSGTTYYYTNYKHEVGDTLLTSGMFIKQEVEERAGMKNEIERLKDKNDSLKEVNVTMKFQYDLMLQFFEDRVIPSEIEKSKADK